LLALTAAVLFVHGWLLQPGPGTVQPSAGARQPALITRSVPAQPHPVEVAAVLPVPPAATLDIVAPTRSAAVVPLLAPPGPRPGGQRPVRAANPPAAFSAADGSSAAKAPPLSTPAAAERLAFTIPGSMLLHYKVTAHARGLELNGQGQLRWRNDGKDYEAKLELSGPLLPSRTQQSIGTITAQGLAPLRFSDKARSEEAAHFERDQGKVSFSSNRPDAPLMAGAQDRLSVLMQLGAMIAGRPKNFGPGTTISIQTASTRDAEVWQFTVEGPDTLQLAGRELNAIKLIRNPRKEFDQKIELWLAPALDYVPVRLRLTQPNGDWVDQQWSSTDKG
jgi:hypothetical protein